MSKGYILITEVEITKAGQVKNFQIKLPKNAKAITAVDTDVRIKNRMEIIIRDIPTEVLPIKSLIPAIKQMTFLTWVNGINKVMGRIKLQSLERANIFYADWVYSNDLDGGIGNFLGSIYPTSPYTLLKMPEAKKVDVTSDTTVVNGIYRDYYGVSLNRDIAYIIKVFLWIELDIDCEMKGEKK